MKNGQIINYDTGQQCLEEKKARKKAVMVEIMRRYHSGNAEDIAWAKEQMINENAGFIGATIKAYFGNFEQNHYHELFNECVIAILENMDKFDPEQGTSTTFFTKHLFHAMSTYTNSISNKSTSYYSANMNKIRAALSYFEQKQVEPSISDIALHTGLSVQKVEHGLERINATNEVYCASEAELDAVLKKESGNPEDDYIAKERTQILGEALACLNKADREMLMMKFGFDEDKQMSYSAIAKATGLPVNQVTASIARSLRILADNVELSNLMGRSPSRKRKRAVNQGSEITLIPDVSFIDAFTDDFDEGEEIPLKVSGDSLPASSLLHFS